MGLGTRMWRIRFQLQTNHSYNIEINNNEKVAFLFFSEFFLFISPGLV